MVVRVYDERQKVLKKIREDRYKKNQLMSGRYQRAFYATDYEYFAAQKIINVIRDGTKEAVGAIETVLNF